MAIHARIVLSLLVSAAALSAQQGPPAGGGEAASFEVASVKPNKSGASNAVPRSLSNGSYSASNVALKSVIANAYEVRIFEIEGDPAWLTTDRFDIIARGREGTPDRLRPAMLRALLAERFKLAAHLETREREVYALTLLRPDGRLGPQLKPSAPSATGPAPVFPIASAIGGVGRVNGERILMDNLATVLSGSVLRQRVINRTGLKGEFDLDVRFAPDSLATASELPSIFTAVQDQLGLRLQSERAPVPVLVIDSVQRPTPD